MARRKQPIKTAKPARKVVVEPKEKSYWLLGTALLFLGSFLLISLVGLDTGTIGRNLVKGLRFIFGVGAFFVPTFFIGGAVLGESAIIPSDRQEEFRETVLKLKPAHLIAFTFVNYI